MLPLSAGAKATGIESVKLPFLPDASGSAEAVKAKLDKAANDFESSDFLKGLKERSEQNREKCVSHLCQNTCKILILYTLRSKVVHHSLSATHPRNKKDIQDKYCIRQAEMGVGDVSVLPTALVPSLCVQQLYCYCHALLCLARSLLPAYSAVALGRLWSAVQCAGLRLIPGMTKSGLQKEKTLERKFLEFLTGSKDEEQ